MEPITLPNRPQGLPATSKIMEYEDGGIYIRVMLTLRSQIDQAFIGVEAQAYEMTQAGNFVMSPLGFPSRTPTTTHNILASAIGKTTTIGPGWVQHAAPNQTVVNAENLLEGVVAVTELPATAPVDTVVYKDPWLYKYSAGEAEIIARAKAEELLSIVRNSAILSGTGFSF